MNTTPNKKKRRKKENEKVRETDRQTETENIERNKSWPNNLNTIHC